MAVTVRGVDTHTHIVRTDTPLVAERHSAPTRETTVPELLGLLDAHGLSHAVLTAPSFYGTDNSVLLAALAAGGGRLLGTVNVDPAVTADELARYAECGVVGLRLNWSSRTSRPDAGSAAYRRLFRAAAAAGLHVELLVEPEWFGAVADPVLAEGARLVVDHLALLDDIESGAGRRLLAALDAGSTWVKLSAPYRLRDADAARRTARAVYDRRPDRVLWGSDWPWVSHERDGFGYADTLGWLDDWVPERRQVLVDNPAALLGLVRTSTAKEER